MFRIGQKVVCVDGLPPHLIKDTTYTITDISSCACGKSYVSYGAGYFGSYKGISYCADCLQPVHTPKKEWYCYASRFRPLSYSTNCNKEIIEKFSPLEEKSDVQIREYEPVKTSLLK